ELPLELLPSEDVAAYLAGRLGGPVASPLVTCVHAHTDGHPLFLVTIVEHLVEQRLLARREGQWTLRAGGEARVAPAPQEVRQVIAARRHPPGGSTAGARGCQCGGPGVCRSGGGVRYAGHRRGRRCRVRRVGDARSRARGHWGDRLARWDAWGHVPLSPC